MKRVVGRFGRWLWYLGAMLVVGCAALVSLGQYYFPYLDNYRSELLAGIEGRVPFGVELSSLHAEWTGLSPTFHFSGLRLHAPGDPSLTIFSAPAGNVSIDIVRSVLARAPRLRRISVQDVRLAFVQEADGRWHVAGLDSGSSRAPVDRDQILGFFLAIEEIELERAELQLHPAAGGLMQTQDARIVLENYLNFRRLRLVAQDPTRGAALDLLLEASGDPREEGDFEANAYARFRQLPVERFQPLAGSRLRLPVGALTGELWAGVDRQGRVSAQGELNTASLQLPFPEQTPLASAVEDLSARFALEWAKGAGTLWLEQSRGRWLGQELQLDRARLDTGARGAGRRFSLAADYIDLGSFAAALQASETLKDPWASALADLAPYGGLNDVHVDLDRVPGQRPDVDVRASLRDVSASPWKDAPGVRNVRGFLHAGIDGGRVDIDSGATSLEFPRLYRNDIDVDSIKGSVYWRRDAEGVEVGAERLQFASAKTGFDAMFRLHFFRDPLREDDFSLAIGLRDADLTLHRQLVPFVVSSTVREWLEDAIRGGRAQAGEFALRLGFGRQDGAHPMSVQLLLDVDGAAVRYHPAWPAVDDVQARLALDEKQLRIEAGSGTVYDSRIERALVGVDLGRKPARLQVDGAVKGPLGDGLRVINDSPLAGLTRGALRDWLGSGDLQVDLRLDMPIGGTLLAGQSTVDVNALIGDASLGMPAYRLEMRDIAGSLRFGLADGLASDDLQGTLWGRPIAARIGAGAGGRGELAVQVDGTVAVPDLETWLGVSGASMLDGVAPFRFGLRQEGQTLVSRVDSDLVGVGSTIPAPFAKDAGTPMPISLNWWPTDDGVAWRAGLGDVAQLALQARDDAVSGEVVFGSGAAPESGGEGLRLRGVVPGADAGAWIAAIPRWLKSNAGNGTGALTGLRIEGLRVQNTTLWNADIGEASIDAQREKADFVVAFAAPPLAGQFRVPGKPASDLHLRLDRIDLKPFLPGDDQEAAGGSRGWDALRDAELPRLAVEIASAKSGERDLGQWNFLLHGSGGLISADGITARLRGASILPLSEDEPARLSLSWPDGTARTSVAARMEFQDIGAFFDNWEQPRALESRTGTGEFRLDWSGVPTDYAVANSNGTMRLTFKDGRLLRGGGNNPLMRAIGLLRFDELLRRMKFDFKDFYQSGLAFDRFKAPITFSGGVASTDPQVELVGPTARLRLEGRSDLRAQQIDANLTVTLPIGSNLPWLAAVAGGLPVAAGVFVASRLFEDQIGKLSSAVYSVKGSLEDPKVEFQQVFDVEEAPTSSRPAADSDTPSAASGPAQTGAESATVPEPVLTAPEPLSNAPESSPDDPEPKPSTDAGSSGT